MSIPRGTTLAGRLASLGFADADGAERLIAGRLALDVQGADGELVGALAAAADPDAALAGLARLAPDAGLLAALRADPDLRTRLTAVLGASAALSDHLARHPADWRVLSGPDAAREPGPGELRAALLASVGADPADPEPVSGLASASLAAADPAPAPDRLPAPVTRRGRPARIRRPACGSPTGAPCCGSPPGISPGRSPSIRRPPSCPTWPPPRWRRPSRSRGPSCRPVPRRPGSR